MSTPTRPPLRTSRWLDGGPDGQPRTYAPGDPSKRLRLLALGVAFTLTIFAARLVDLQLLNRTPRAEAAVTPTPTNPDRNRPRQTPRTASLYASCEPEKPARYTPLLTAG